MIPSRYRYAAIRLTILGLLIHYTYSIILFAISQVSEGQSLLFKTMYLGMAGLPIIALCTLTLRKAGRSKT